MDEKQKAELRGLLTAMQPAELMQAIRAEQLAQAHEAELAKTHPLVGFLLPEKEFDALCAHLTDGGGVSEDMAPSLDGRPLTLILWQAIYDRDQATFWRELPHLVKSWVAQRGLIRPVPGAPGAVIVSGLEAPPMMK